MSLPDIPVRRRFGGDSPAISLKESLNAVRSLDADNLTNATEQTQRWQTIAIVLAHEVERLRGLAK